MIATGPVVSGVFNAASWMPAGLPGHGIAQGSMFVLTGVNMGPGTLVFPGTLPLPTVMETTSIEVTVGGVTANAFMVKDGVVFTPIANGTFLAGITRGRHMANLRADGVEVVEKVLTFGSWPGANRIV